MASFLLSRPVVSCYSFRVSIRSVSSSSASELADFIRKMASTKNSKTSESSNKPRHVRMKERGRDPGLTSRILLQIISNGYAGTSKSLILNNDQTNYLFNSGEMTQRILQEKNTAWETKFSKTKHIFITRKSWDTIGGLLGVCISLKESFLNEITFHAPCDVIDLLKHWKGLEAFTNVTLEQHDYEKSKFEDDCFKINAIPLRIDQQEGRKIESKSGLSRFPDDLVYAYLCETHPFPPTLSAELCAFHRVPPTQFRARLKNGEDVTLPDGRLIRSKDVTLPGEPPVKVLILDCPALDYMRSIENSDIMNHSYHTIVHLGPISILNNEIYRSWMRKLTTVHHLFLDETQKNVHIEALYRYQTQLNYIDKQMFPLLSYHQILSEPKQCPDPVENIVYGLTSTRISIRPTLGPDQSRLVSIQPQTYIDLMLENEEFNQTFKEHQEKLQSLQNAAADGPRYPEIIFLGTGSACPSKPRNTSGILVHLSEENFVLLECAEGTLGQILQFYGDQADQVLTRIRAAYLSHMHADHLGGLFGLLRQRRRAFDNQGKSYEKLLLFCPNKYLDVGRKQWTFFSNSSSFDEDVDVVFNRKLNNGLMKLKSDSSTDQEKRAHEKLRFLGFQDMQTILVEHIYDAHALVLKHQDGWSIGFSGDCKPSSNFIQAGQNVDLLIHEATYETGMELYASQMRHCTMSQAVDVGRLMNAKHTILWHFSQRYAKIPFRDQIKDELKSDATLNDRVSISFDFMRLRLSDLPRACALVPVFESMCYEDWLTMKKRQTRREQEPDYFANNARMIEAKRKSMHTRSSPSTNDGNESRPKKTTASVISTASKHS